MEALVTIAIILGMIALGAFMLHRLSTQQAERIANRHYTPSRRPPREERRQAGPPHRQGPPAR